MTRETGACASLMILQIIPQGLCNHFHLGQLADTLEQQYIYMRNTELGYRGSSSAIASDQRSLYNVIYSVNTVSVFVLFGLLLAVNL